MKLELNYKKKKNLLKKTQKHVEAKQSDNKQPMDQ